MPVDRILCPVDFSELSGQALRYAAALARCRGAKLTVLYAHSFQAPAYFTESKIEALEQQLRDSLSEADTALKRFATANGADAAGTMVVEGYPPDAIRKAARETRAGLIVLGTHGRSGVNRLMLGSVAERVLRESDIPVLTVRGEGGTAPEPPKRVLCPVNHTPAAREAVQAAQWFAECFGGKVTVAHVAEERPERRIDDVCNWVPEAARPHCDVRDVSGEGDAAEAILTLARAESSDLLVIGSEHRRFFDSTVLGSTTARVVRHAPCPVLTVPAPRHDA